MLLASICVWLIAAVVAWCAMTAPPRSWAERERRDR
jgi:hypothetical protein